LVDVVAVLVELADVVLVLPLDVVVVVVVVLLLVPCPRPTIKKHNISMMYKALISIFFHH